MELGKTEVLFESQIIGLCGTVCHRVRKKLIQEGLWDCYGDLVALLVLMVACHLCDLEGILAPLSDLDQHVNWV